jgi:hypothetical protein
MTDDDLDGLTIRIEFLNLKNHNFKQIRMVGW